MHNFTLASPPIPNIKFLSFVVSEKCVILKICTFSIKKKHDCTRKKQQINLNFELALNNGVIMLPKKNYVDRPKTKSCDKEKNKQTNKKTPHFRNNSKVNYQYFGTSLAWYRYFNVNEQNVPSFTSKYTMLAIIL